MNKVRSSGLRNLVLVLVVLGVLLRFYNLDRKVYWYDETMTSLRVSGNTLTTITEEVFTGDITTVGDLLANYQYPNANRDLDDTLTALKGNPEHSPLYYLLARFWFQLFGNSIAIIRTMSVLFGILVIPAAYWLGQELFGKVAISGAIAAVIAISPFHVLYSQEAREYSLWTLSILVSSAALLRSLRRNTPTSWSLYGLTVALGLYTHPFSGFVSIGHGIHVLVTEGFRWSRKFTAYLLASGLGLLLFLPWLIVVVQYFTRFVDNTASVNLNRAGFLPLFWLLNLNRVFFDVNQGPSPLNPLHYIIAALVGYAIYILCRQAPLSAWVFVITLMGVMGLALIGPDVLLGGRRSSITRYAVPSFLGIQIAVAYLFANKLTLADLPRKQWNYWRNGAIALAVCGIISCAVSSQIPVWWHKSYAKSRHNPAAAELINQRDRLLLASDQIPGEILAFSHLLNPDISLQLVSKPDVPQIPDNVQSQFQNVLLYKPSSRVKRRLPRRQNLQLTEIYQDNWLWQVDQQSAVSDQQSAVSDQRSAVSGQWSVVSGQWSTVSDQRSAISGQRSAISSQ